MFIPKPGTKQDPIRQWNLSDRAFFGHGACHILAYAFLERFPDAGFGAVWIKPAVGYRGNHVFVTNGSTAFDYRGYLCQERLLSHYWREYCRAYSGWHANLVSIHGNPSDPKEMAAIGMQVRGPDQFLNNALPRARTYLSSYDACHAKHIAR